ncbi:pyruvate ferredoxin oxidoreductase, gamma subunit [Methanocella conradii HZ254]|uniref:pyruvate synthase n=1 Tax=Methanocella conradii (strain DSM 24694 / JCM 17849 / CGMCC 1.5162 / HZ254) TaxID=1041930 RepID=H8I9Q7_METCZ|nr:2-oxoacid:acceptor oxidoreductase family protein [Methanocella conradii]AFD00508.1 pyruvate ferredoxin oxidoreductase, gamma subunit [Methanocella conradii HZ254]
MLEIRIHSRGGQGGVTASKLLAQAAFLEGKYSTAFPLYGAERRGAPVTSFTRISDHDIKVVSQIYEPDIVVVLDDGIMDLVDVTEGLKDGGLLLVNTDNGDKLKGPKYSKFRVARVNVTDIALSLGLVLSGNPILNTPILGALARLGVVKLESAEKAIRDMFEDERNVQAARAAYEKVIA